MNVCNFDSRISLPIVYPNVFLHEEKGVTESLILKVIVVFGFTEIRVKIDYYYYLAGGVGWG